MTNLDRTPVKTDKAPGAIGPYNQAIIAGGFVHCSGQVAFDPESGQIVEGDAATQCRQVMKNLGSVLAAAGVDFSHAVRCTIFLTNLDDFAAVNEVYGSFFEGMEPPARACVQVSRLPRNVSVEIDCLALAPEGSR